MKAERVAGLDFYRALFESNEIPTLIIDTRNGGIVEANRSACEFYGYEEGKLSGATIDKINTAPPEKTLESLRAVLGKRPHSYLFRHRLADGREAQVVSTVGPLGGADARLVYSMVQSGDLFSSCGEVDRGLDQRSGSQLDHIVKNNLQLLDSMLSLSMGAEASGRRDRILRMIRSKIQIIGSVYDYSRRYGEYGAIPANRFARAILENARGRMDAGNVDVRLDCGESARIGVAEANPVGFILDYLIERALDRASERVDIPVLLTVRGSDSVLELSASGPYAGEEADVPVEREIIQAAASQLGTELEAGGDPLRGGWIRCSIDRTAAARAPTLWPGEKRESTHERKEEKT